MLVILGATPEEKKELVGFQVGVRGSAQSWRELLVDIKVRGLAVSPEIAVGDGAMGLWRALDEVFPSTRHQWCWVHNIANVLNKFPKSMPPTLKADLREIWQADTRATAEWVEVHLSVDYGAFRSFGRVYPQDIDPDPDLLAEEERLIAREEELAAQNDGEDWSDAETEEYYAIEPRLREIEALQRGRQPYAEEDRAIAGVVLTIGHDGALRVEKGLVRPEDIPAAPEPDEVTADADGAPSPARPQVTPPTSSTPVPSSDPAATLRKADGISVSLADDLRATRQRILRAHLAADFEVAFDAMLYALCEQALGRSYNNEALDISIRPFEAQDREVLHADTVAQKMLEALEQDLATDWMKLEKPEDFRAMSTLPIADKQALFAWATGLAVKPQLSSDNRPSPIIEEIGARLDVEVAACWRPTAQNYWGRVNKGHAVATARKLIGDDFAEDRNRERKGDIAAAMERAFAETAGETEGIDAATAAKTTRWLPDGMVFVGATEAVAKLIGDAPEAEEGDAV